MNSFTVLLPLFVAQTFPEPSTAMPYGALAPVLVNPVEGESAVPAELNSLTLPAAELSLVASLPGPQEPPLLAVQILPEPSTAMPIGTFRPPPV